MPIANTDIILRLSGGAGNSNPAASLGGAKSSTAFVTNVVENLFPNVTGSQSAAGRTEYLCVYYHNGHGSLTANNARAYITSNTTSTGDDLAIGVGTAAINGTEQTIGVTTTEPSGITWGAPANYDAATNHVLGNIPSGQHKAIWIRRIVNPGAGAKDNNVATLEIGVDTSE